MRVAPLEINRMLRQYDRDLGIEWCPKTHGWYFMYQGTRQQSALLHPDGSSILNLYPSEVMDIVERTDQNKHYGSFLKRLNKAQRLRENEYLRKSAADKRIAEMRKETEDRIEVKLRGAAKPFSYITDNPLSKEMKDVHR